MLLDFDPNKYDASLCAFSKIPLALYLDVALGGVSQYLSNFWIAFSVSVFPLVFAAAIVPRATNIFKSIALA